MSASKSKGLGKGLGALLSSDAVIASDQRAIVELPINDVSPNRAQPRKDFAEDKLQELAASIQSDGIIQPLIVTRLGEGNYQIVAGERRWRAARIAGLKTVPCIIRDLGEEEILRQALIENIQREDLNPIETAQGLKRLQDEHNMTQEELSTNVGKSRPAVANLLRLLNLSDTVQDLVADGSLSAGHARALLGLTQTAMQDEAATIVVERGLSVRDTEALVRKLNAPPKPVVETEEDETAYRLACRSVEEKLAQALGSKVKVRDNKGKGKVVIDYYSLEDLDRIIDLIVEE